MKTQRRYERSRMKRGKYEEEGRGKSGQEEARGKERRRGE